MNNKIRRLFFVLCLSTGLVIFLLRSFVSVTAETHKDGCMLPAPAASPAANCRPEGEKAAPAVAPLAWIQERLAPDDAPQPQLTLEDVYQNVLDAGAYEFTAESEQTLLPRPQPNMIGRTDQRVDMHVEGEVTLPDFSLLSLSLDGAGLDPTPISVLQEGTESYLLREGEKIPFENPAGLTSPTGDYLNYLAAAENVSPCDSEDVPFAEAAACYTYESGGSLGHHVLGPAAAAGRISDANAKQSLCYTRPDANQLALSLGHSH